MITLTVVFDDHHVNSAREMAKIVRNDWAAVSAVLFNGSETKIYFADHIEGCTSCKPLADELQSKMITDMKDRDTVTENGVE